MGDEEKETGEKRDNDNREGEKIIITGLLGMLFAGLAFGFPLYYFLTIVEGTEFDKVIVIILSSVFAVLMFVAIFCLFRILKINSLLKKIEKQTGAG